MTHLHISTECAAHHTAPCYIFLTFNDIQEHLPHELEKMAHAWYPDLRTLLKAESFTGNAGQKIVIPVIKNNSLINLIIVGVGSKNQSPQEFIERYRRAVGAAVRQVQKLKATSAVISQISYNNVLDSYLLEQAIITSMIASYTFDEFITKQERKNTPLDTLTLVVKSDTNLRDAEHHAYRARIIGSAVNRARTMINLPPSTVTPTYLAKQAQKIATEHALTATIFNEKQVIEMGMGGLAGVSRGSDEECAFIILEYKTDKPHAPTLALVGKGITFDSGGLSIKPANSMEEMKNDMAGAAAVISTLAALAELKPDINVIGIAPASENLLGGKATKPGDILRFYNGKTAEVRNTDAEGRLILADALSYAVKHYKPDAIIDIATLTGACSYALGPFNSGLMSRHNELVERIQKAAIRAGDPVWRLPMSDDYKEAIKSPVADICNIGSKTIMAGATTAAHFLEEFVENTPWAHLDIAGTAYNVPNIPYYQLGATGVGVRLMIEIALSWQSESAA